MEKFLLHVSGLVKRDTAADIENSLKNVFGSNDNPLEDLQVCVRTAQAPKWDIENNAMDGRPN